jgi:hypothetical protein
MLFEPIADTGHRPSISVGTWMRAVEDPDLPEEHHRDPAALSLTDFRPKLYEQCFDSTPWDIGTDWMGKDGFQGSSVRSSHGENGTAIRYYSQASRL